MIPSSNSTVKRRGTLNHYVGDLLHTMAISRLSRVRTEAFQLLVIPSSAPHPVGKVHWLTPSNADVEGGYLCGTSCMAAGSHRVQWDGSGWVTIEFKKDFQS
jgi:hypothetical protein